MYLNNVIDIVYLWVDGKDPVWRQKKLAAELKEDPSKKSNIAIYGNVEGRYRNNDELRFSLRTLEKFFPDHGHVYIITDQQKPNWLLESAKLTIIDHRDLLPANKLPTFDSGNIESYIHKIPTLSEYYFYLNDDMFFGKPVDVHDWFWETGTFVSWSDDEPVPNLKLLQESTALENACRLSINWLLDRGYSLKDEFLAFKTFAHGPRPAMKSLMEKLEIETPELFDSVRSTTFREWDKPPIISDFSMRWALATGRSKLREYSSIYISTGDVHDVENLRTLVSRFGNLDFFCINDTTDDSCSSDSRLINVNRTLKELTGSASSFERHII